MSSSSSDQDFLVLIIEVIVKDMSDANVNYFFLCIMLTFLLGYFKKMSLVVLVKILNKSHRRLSTAPKPPKTKYVMSKVTL